jgi:endonuclease/exonuclease/phosphatase family metal-dependent hydrolase
MACWLVFLVLVAGCSRGTAQSDAPKPAPPVVAPPATADFSLRILGWNVESGGNDPRVIAGQLSQFKNYGIIALSEVHPTSFDIYKNALGDDRIAVMSGSGRSDRLMFLVDSRQFQLIESQELNKHEAWMLNDGRHRSPFTAYLRHRETGFEFIVMTNHLARGNAEFRQEQASGLREWARDQTLPVIAIGDFNFDYNFAEKEGNEAFSLFMQDGVWKWIRPEPLIDSNWSDDGKGGDRYPGSMLDFAFVASSAKGLACKCRVIVTDGDFPDDDATSDHRPVELIVQVPAN